MHLRQLQLGFGAHSGRESRVSDDVPQRLSIASKSAWACLDVCDGGDAVEAGSGSGVAGCAHLSVSNSSKTLRFVWSRMVRALTKQPRSSFLARNMDILGGRCLAGLTARMKLEAGSKPARISVPAWPADVYPARPLPSSPRGAPRSRAASSQLASTTCQPFPRGKRIRCLEREKRRAQTTQCSCSQADMFLRRVVATSHSGCTYAVITFDYPSCSRGHGRTWTDMTVDTGCRPAACGIFSRFEPSSSHQRPVPWS